MVTAGSWSQNGFASAAPRRVSWRRTPRARDTSTEFRQALRFNDEATGNGATRRRQVYDQQIAADVKRALEQSREVNAWNLKVEVFQGEVTLSGPVRTLREKQAAEQLAAQVTGVTNVFNQLAIRQ